MSAKSDAKAVRSAARPLRAHRKDYDALLERIADAQVVLLGESTCGSHELYRERALITKRLVREKGFGAVAVDGDWADAYRVNRYVRDLGMDRGTEEALGAFSRFPSWRWRNAEVLEFVGWLRTHNDAAPWSEAKVGFYGLDLFGLSSALESVVAALDAADPEAARRARRLYADLDHRARATSEGGKDEAELGLAPALIDQVVADLIRARRIAAEFEEASPLPDDEALFAAQSAGIARDFEAYCRALVGNHRALAALRERHMAETLGGLVRHMERAGDGARVVVWGQNAELGDARATDGRIASLGQLARERFGERVVSVLFTTFTGWLTAAREWGGPGIRRPLRPALAGSYEAVLHEVGIPSFQLDLARGSPTAVVLAGPRPERAIGLVYRPAEERVRHYLPARLPQQFDWLVHIDETSAVMPLENTADWMAGERSESLP